MNRPRIKICGITTVDDALLAARLGADAIGLNLFAGSKRHVPARQAMEIATALPPFVEAVALVVNDPLPAALAQAETIGRTLQWHGNEPGLPPPLPWRFIPAFNIADHGSLTAVKDYLAKCKAIGRMPAAVLLDGHAAGQFGGTGQTVPWKLIADFDAGVPVILAGGLTPDNVAEAIRIVRPYAVDVASGVESSPGRKDPEKTARFVEAVRSV